MLRTFRLIDVGALSAVVWLVAACAESNAPTASKNLFRTEMITCEASLSVATLTCGESRAQASSGMNFNRVLGGQGALVRLASSGTQYNPGTATFASNVTVENLVAQPMNTADGTTPDAGGIKVFFHSGPTATGGSGTVTVANPDGTGTFTGTGQPYFTFSDGGVLASGATSNPKSWQFTVPTTVTQFTFQVFVTTRLPDEVSPIVALGLSRSPSALTIAPGGSGTTTVTLTRTHFTDPVTLSLGGAPSGVTGSFSPAAPTGTSSTLTVNVGSLVAPGTYPLTINGTSGAGPRSTKLTLNVGTGSGNVTVDFSGCPVGQRAVWVAAQDGVNPWTRITGTGDVYTFTIGSSGGGLAYVVVGASDAAAITVRYMTQAEFTAGTLVQCPPPPTGKTINGDVAGAAFTDRPTISLGGSEATVFTFLSSTFQLTDVPDGNQDLVAYRQSLANGPESAIIRRAQNIADNGTIATLDFNGVEAFAPATATITLGGLLGGEQVNQNMSYQVGANCTTAGLYFGATGGATFTASGIPSIQQVGTDFHALTVFASLGNDSRFITQYNHTLADRTLTLGAVMPVPVITTLATPPAYKRLQAAYNLPIDYEGSTSFGYNDGANKSVTISATFGYLGGTSTTLALPDFSALSGWDNNWPPATSSTGDWNVSGSSVFPASACTEGATFKSATVNGTF